MQSHLLSTFSHYQGILIFDQNQTLFPQIMVNIKRDTNTQYNMSLKHTFEYGLLRTLIFPLNILPVPIINGFARILGWIVWIIYPFRIQVAYTNLSTVFPDLNHSDKIRLLRKVYLQFARTVGLVFILHRKPLFKLIKEADVKGLDILDRALEKGKGVILTTYHGCWFEAYFAWFNYHHRPTSLIYQEQSNPLSDSFFRRQRKRYGNSLEHLQSNAGMKRYQQALSENRTLIISLDQSYRNRGAKVPLFNRPIGCAKGTSILHMRTGAPILTSVYYMKDNRLCIDIDEVELPSFTQIDDQAIVDISTAAIRWYEPYIKRHPDQWFSLFHRLWSKTGYPKKISRTFKEILL